MKQIYILNQFTQQPSTILKISPIDLMSNGTIKLRQYKDMYPNAKIFVDTKITDADFRLVEDLSLVDADIISVIGTCTNETICYILRKVQAAGKKVVVDLSGSENLNDRMLDMDIYGVDYVSIDNEDFIEL